jgi:hypothetical protein
MSEDKKTYEDFMKFDADEGMSMFHRRMLRTELISSDMALQIAQMVFFRVYGREYTEERMPLVIIDREDRWEINTRDGVPSPQRIKMIIMKTNGRILELVSW